MKAKPLGSALTLKNWKHSSVKQGLQAAMGLKPDMKVTFMEGNSQSDFGQYLILVSC